uniref:Large ribosomal subunit protein uL29c n=1 Tax=Gracilaria tenuistipitata var. liui TaxID=285951 RepID=RK29_GRATL|nr:ribosomal protein L29 [Gracilaria tenuistipitata var. liui]Q6B8W1.1 RecName: Full=Large ribosomal subunit protein uL29c; AltName: Full=50S ribosomal protein L29, chloroplastic [Gracilaria tenuistipitata var. liui]AAT79674.1 50S ribosomal protein L29 [Gracilaria tenuistipitata var. liui]
MPLPKIQDIQDFTDKEIEEKIIKLKKEIFDLKLKQATRQNVRSHLFKHKKHQLAQLLTIKKDSNYV